MAFPIDSPFVRETLTRLVRINSVNPRLDPDSPGEREIADYYATVLSDLGLRTAVHEAAPGRPSVVGVRRGRGGSGAQSLMLNAHLDTVGVDDMDDPFAAAERDGRVYGRGAFDMKGSLAAMAGAVKALRDADVSLAGDLVVAGVADEEYSSLGTTDIIPRYPVDGAIVTEPTHLRVCLAHKGYVWFKVTTHGRAAHGSRFDEGVDANLRMGRVLSELAVLEAARRTGPAHPLVGPPSLHAATLRGGTGVSTYAATCELHIERRTVPGETVAQTEAEVAGILDGLCADDPAFEATWENYFAREPFEVAPEAAIVQAVDGAVETVTGSRSPHIGDTPWMDAALLAEAGVETVVIGPAGGGAHAAEEWVEVDSVVALAGILAEAAVTYCGRAT